MRRQIEGVDATDGFSYEDFEYQGSDQNLPGTVEIVELDNDDVPLLGDGDYSNDPDYEPEFTSARSRGNVARNRKVPKEKRSRSKSRGRKTRSQSAAEKQDEIAID